MQNSQHRYSYKEYYRRKRFNDRFLYEKKIKNVEYENRKWIKKCFFTDDVNTYIVYIFLCFERNCAIIVTLKTFTY